MTGLRFYLASTLPNHAAADLVADVLIEAGHQQTYRWSKHGPAGHLGAEGLGAVAAAEVEGVAAADVVIVLLPGGRGTHAELGMALALGKPVVLWDPSGEAFRCDNRTCAFYHHPGVALQFGLLVSEKSAKALAECLHSRAAEWRRAAA